ncbi:MAG TPA: 1-acyl-sn-glycerol-3-phosphate acyltransferase [Chlamydiales bacterium]|nr:1-acyl-sn-glycerol-3-phosphate acyltransferase [Chlamydiales bacterium]
MAKELTPEESHLLNRLRAVDEIIPEKYRQILLQFYNSYREAILSSGKPIAAAIPMLLLFLQLIEEQFKHPHSFQPYHQKVRHPFDYYRFGLDFIRPLVDINHSRIYGEEHLNTILSQLKKGDNVVLLANHQTEPDPQIIALLLEKKYPALAEKIIYVAGERVVTEPLAIPFSLGCDLLCIYSKRYIDHPPELKAKKQLHNKNTMELMSRLLQEGGKIIYVAPSGGRDRRNAQGIIEISPFDPQSIEMFYLMARKAKTPTHFYPFTLSTYNAMPPPETVQTELGETRSAQRTPIYLAFAPEFNMEHFPGSDENDKTLRRQHKAEAIWKIVSKNYKLIQDQQ